MDYTGEDNLELMKVARNYNNSLVSLIVKNRPIASKTILDFGSGDGWFAKAVKQATGQEVMCIEPADNLWKYYDIQPLQSLDETKEDTIDFIYSLNVLEHIENDQAIIDKFYRTLKPDGTILLYLPAFPCLYSSMDKHVGHYRRYTKNDVKRLFNNKLWTIDEVYYADSLGWFVSLLFKYISRGSGAPSLKMLKFYDKIIYPMSLLLDKLSGGHCLGKNIIIKAHKRVTK